MNDEVEVSRELIAEAALTLRLAGGNDGLADELRALLAAPVVERQPVSAGDAIRAMTKRDWELVAANATCSQQATLISIQKAELQATIAQLTAEIERISEFRRRWIRRTLKARDQRDSLKAEIERLKAGQGEPVATVRGVIERRISAFDIVIHDSGSLHIGTKLYTSQPTPVSVVLPEPKGVLNRSYDSPAGHLDAQAIGWNACLDKAKELNQ